MTVGAPPIAVFGTHDEKTLEQLETCASHGEVARAALMADGHFGYSQPIGGVIGYREQISPSGVGYDIACGNKAVRTMLTWADIENDLPRLADEIFANIAFGVGRVSDDPVAAEHELFDDGRWNLMPEIANLKQMARNQLGTVGSGNHYVDIFVEGAGFIFPDRTKPVIADDSRIWIGVHFGSRGFGHKTASGFLNLANGLGFADKPRRGELPQDEPTLIDTNTDLGYHYLAAMGLAGDYAYAGRSRVVERVLDILGTTADLEVHNHHNFAWEEEHFDEKLWVVRKGATPLWPDQLSFIGGSMCDIAVIARGSGGFQKVADVTEINGDPNRSGTLYCAPQPSIIQRDSMFSTVHGAGRVMGRMEAKGKKCKACKDKTKYVGCPTCETCGGSGMMREGKVTPDMLRESVQKYAPLQLRGAGLDESAFVYRRLDDVLQSHSESTKVEHILRPVIVCMAGANEFDPYKDS